MVDPISQDERDSFNRKLRVAVAALVAASAGMVALGTGASPLQAGVALLVGVVIGGVIAWYAVPSSPAPAERRGSSIRDDPFADGGESGSDGTDRGSDEDGERVRSSGSERRE